MNIHSLFDNNRPSFSLEIFPPKKTSGIEGLYRALYDLSDLNPDFISVTYGAGGGEAGDETIKIASYIKNELNIEPLTHMTCVNSTREEVDKHIEKLKANNIENVLALRGDLVEGCPLHPDFLHASDLVKVIKAQSNMNVVGACYPEGHYEHKKLDEDIELLKIKLDMGVSHLITQLFFDNSKFYTFMDKLQKAGIDVPVEAGIMPITTIKQIERTIALSGASLPVEFTHMVSKYSQNPEALYHAGIAYAIDQICDLLKHGVSGIHLYTMNHADVARSVYNGIKSYLGR